ncbi:MAG: hypothetical protein AAF390_16560 [Pseudomonadota bacterium]
MTRSPEIDITAIETQARALRAAYLRRARAGLVARLRGAGAAPARA